MVADASEIGAVEEEEQEEPAVAAQPVEQADDHEKMQASASDSDGDEFEIFQSHVAQKEDVAKQESIFDAVAQDEDPFA